LDKYSSRKECDRANARYNITPEVIWIELLSGVKYCREVVNTHDQTDIQVQGEYQTGHHEGIEEMLGK
jgi:hypothetical protein